MAADEQPENTLFVVEFDKELGVFVDQQGIMLPAGDVQLLAELTQKHLAHSKLELRALGRMSVERHGPGTVAQFNFDYFEDGPAPEDE